MDDAMDVDVPRGTKRKADDTLPEEIAATRRIKARKPPAPGIVKCLLSRLTGTFNRL